MNESIDVVFLSIYNFVKEVLHRNASFWLDITNIMMEEQGCIEESCFTYTINSNLDEVSLTAYINSFKKLNAELKVVVKQLINYSAIHPSLRSAGGHVSEGNDANAASGTEMKNIYMNQNYVQTPLLNTYNTFLNNKEIQDKIVEFRPICGHAIHNQTQEGFTGSSQEIIQTTSKEFAMCTSNNLLVPFSNLDINGTCQTTSLINSMSDEQGINNNFSITVTDQSSSFPVSVMAEGHLFKNWRTTNAFSGKDEDPFTLNATNTFSSPLEAIAGSSNANTENVSNYCKCTCKESPEHECSYCNSRISREPSKSTTNQKSKKRASNNTHPCSKCKRVFRTWKHLSIHINKVHKDDECSDCVINELNRGENLRKSNLPIYCCKTCNTACREISQFDDHTCRLPNEEGTDIPPNLSNRILITNVLKLHQMRKFVCDVCGVEYRTLKRILYHLPRCFPGPYPCNVCSELFASQKELNYHKKKTHKGEKCFVCDECGKSFQRRASLRKHSIHWHESKNVSASSEANPISGSFKCDECHKKFIKKIFLTNHKIRNHGLDKKFLCQVCGNKFMTKNSLMIHMEIHKEEKKFECSYCCKRFRRKEKLQHHERIHTGEKPFSCPKCKRAFVSKARLNEHWNRHNGEKRYCCRDCSKSYAAAWDLKKHIKKKHNKEPKSVPVMVIPSSTASALSSNCQETGQQSMPQFMSLSSGAVGGLSMPLMQDVQTCQMHHVIQVGHAINITGPSTAQNMRVMHNAPTVTSTGHYEVQGLLDRCLQVIGQDTNQPGAADTSSVSSMQC